MKKIILICVLALCLLLSSCSTVETAENDGVSMFVQIECTSIWIIVYHRETKVMYAVSAGSYNNGTFTPLVNEDGTPMLYGERSEQ